MKHLATLTGLALLAACASTSTPTDPGPEGLESTGTDPQPVTAEEEFTAPAPHPWTSAFEEGAMLLANRVLVEGPPGLVDHLVMRGDDALFERVARTTENGLVQILRPREGVFDPAKAHLDRWNLNAMRELVVTENPNATEVLVIAEGDAVWRSTDGDAQSGDRLTFRGEIEREDPEAPAAPDAAAPATELSQPELSQPAVSQPAVSPPQSSAP